MSWAISIRHRPVAEANRNQWRPTGGLTPTDEFGRRRAELKPGTILMREWNAQAYRVMVVDEGFAWNGKTYDSLSKVAFAITGTNWNGPRFFGLRDKIVVEAKS
jgi:hypothetical protein